MARSDDWWKCLKPILTDEVMALAEGDVDDGNNRLRPLDLAITDLPDDEGGEARRLVIPAMSDPIAARLAGTAYGGDAYWAALKTAPGHIVERAPRGFARHPIGEVNRLVMFVHLGEWRGWCQAHLPTVLPDQAGRLLAGYIQRIERIAEERRQLTDMAREVMAEARLHGFDTVAIRHVLRLRQLDPEKRVSLGDVADIYMRAVELMDGPAGEEEEGDEDDEGG